MKGKGHGRSAIQIRIDLKSTELTKGVTNLVSRKTYSIIDESVIDSYLS